jgi:hypothetical protein
MTTKTYDVAQAINQIIHNSQGETITNRFYPLWNSYSKTGTDRPKWRDFVSRGENAVNAFSAYKYERRLGRIKTGSIFIRPTSGPFKDKIVELSDSYPVAGSYYVVNYPNAIGASALEANNRASAAIFKAIRNAVYQISGPTFLGELRESLKMVRRPAAEFQKSLGKYMLQVEKNLKSIAKRPRSTRFVRDAFGNWQPSGKNLSKKAEIIKMLSDTWLEYSFGWAPLVSDIKNGAVALARLTSEPRSERVSAIGVHELVTLDAVDNLGASQAGFYTKWSIRDSHLIRVSYKVGVSAAMTAPANTTDRLIELCGFSWQNFIPTVWELLPWSFLVDYFLNINSVLEAYTTDMAGVKWASKTVYKGCIRKITSRVDVPYNAAFYGSQFVSAGRQDIGTYQSEVSSVLRTSGIDYPSLQFRLPDTPRQVGNMAALFLAQGRMRTNQFL